MHPVGLLVNTLRLLTDLIFKEAHNEASLRRRGLSALPKIA